MKITEQISRNILTSNLLFSFFFLFNLNHMNVLIYIYLLLINELIARINSETIAPE